MKRIGFLSLLVMFLLLSVEGQIYEKKVLTLDGAKRIATAAETKAVAEKLNVVIAVLDDAGNVVMLQRMDRSPLSSIEIAIGKARTAVGFKVPSATVEGWLTSGGTRLLSLPNVIMIEGGVPIEIDGEVIGAVGVSGASSQQDAEVAKTGIEAMLKTLRR